jgi:hypothetical protein
MPAGRTRETFIALRATRAAHRIATEVALSQIKNLHTEKCRKCGKCFTPQAGGLDARTLCPGCRGAWAPLSPHAARMAWFVEALGYELGIAVGPVRTATFRVALEAKGLHPHACYYVQNVTAVRDVGAAFDLGVHPPPDLDLSGWPLTPESPPVVLRVPELWQSDGRHLHVLALTDRDRGTYERQTASRAFPFLPVADLQQLVAQLHGRDETTVTEAFREWIRALSAGAMSRLSDPIPLDDDLPPPDQAAPIE